ncbi:MAG: TolC family protein [Proteobacteria bacterium]|nr:TolC family protein [Pseudomonadota bacterium]
MIPVPLTAAQRESVAAEAEAKLFEGQEPLNRPVTLYEATARSLKYQMEYRVKMMEQAVALGQLDVGKFDMLPKLTANAGYSTRSNDSFGFGFAPNGTIAANPSASQERTRETSGVSFTWSVLDFGLSYYRAQQLADQNLIAEERRRKALQNLVQDVRLAWWKSEAAQRLLPQIDELLEEVDLAIEKSRVIENRKLLPPMQTASLRRGLLDLEQQISMRRQDLAQSRVELAALLNVPPGTQVQIEPPSRFPAATLELRTRMETLEAVALRNRPELGEEAYKTRVNESEARRAVLALFPNLNLDVSSNYDSNRFLVNNAWTSIGASVAFNLVKVFSLPAVNRSAEAQRKLDEARRLAMGMAVMTQTRIAAVRYSLLAHEFGVWDQATRDDEQIVGYLASSAEVGIDSEFELIRAKARQLVSKINRDITYANLEAALGKIYNSVGLDALPSQVDSHATDALAEQLQARLVGWENENFAPKAPPLELAVMIGETDGVPPALADGFRAAIVRILELSKIKVAGSGEGKLTINSAVVLEPPRDGGRPARVKVALIDAQSGDVRFSSEFKTTLSEPVDEEQWRTLGEGAAYRVIGPVARLQAGRVVTQKKLSAPWGDPDLKLSRTTADTIAPGGRPEAAAADPGSLNLRVARELAWPAVERMSKIELGVSLAQ